MGEAKRRRMATPSPDSGMVILSGEEASQRLIEGRADEVYLPVNEFCRWAKLSIEQFNREVKAGRLPVSGIRRGPSSWSDISVTAHDACVWMAKYRMSN